MRDYDKLWRKITDKDALAKFYGAGLICTPRALVEEILDKLPVDWADPTLTFLDPCSGRGSFLLAIMQRLENAGHSLQHIIENMLFGIDIDQKNVDGTVAMLGGLAYNHNIRCGNSLTEKWSMKFDVVVGNPPYQDTLSVNTKNLWPSFVTQAFAIVKLGGVVAMITPRTWTTNDMYDQLFVSREPYHINVDECARHFPGVGSTFSYFVMGNKPATGSSFTVHTTNGVAVLSRLPSGGIGASSPAALTIMEKVATGIYFPVITSSGYNTMKFSKNDPSVSRTMSPAHPYQVLHKTLKKEGDVFFYSNLLDRTTYGIPRVILNIWVANYGDMVVSDTLLTCQQYRHFPAPSMNEAAVLRTVLLSKLYRFIAQSSVSGGSFTTRSVSRFPVVDLSRCWTDQELYQHFNLTDDEITLIETTIK